jgi:hypothetical protein
MSIPRPFNASFQRSVLSGADNTFGIVGTTHRLSFAALLARVFQVDIKILRY